MSDLFQKIKVWYEKTKTAKFSYKKSGIRPAHDWEVILMVTFVSLCIGSLLTFYFYREINSGSLFVVPKNDGQQETKIDYVMLKKIVDEINSRADSMKNIKQNKTAPPEPSI